MHQVVECASEVSASLKAVRGVEPNGRLLCPRHHRLAHDSRYAKTVHADNKVTFARRT